MTQLETASSGTAQIVQPTLKVAHSVMSISRSAGGLSGAVSNLGKALLSEQNIAVEVFSLRDEYTDPDIGSWSPLTPRIFETRVPRAFGYSADMLPELDRNDLDIMHCHGLWLYPSLAASRWAKRSHRPYLVSPHGMLEPHWELKKSRIKKGIALWMYQRAHLVRAACIHALCAAETRDIRQFGLRNPVCLIPNGVNLPGKDDGSPAPWASEIARGTKVLLCLGRINPKKGIGNLITGLGLLRRRSPATADGWKLMIVGWDQAGHEADLKTRVAELGLSRHVCFCGPLFGPGKESAYRHANAFVLPSFSEGLPLVVVEAWSHGLPVLMTPHCNLPEGIEADAAILAETDPEALAVGLDTMFRMSDDERKAMGARGLALVQERFTWSKVAAQMRGVYDWLVGGGAPPSCVEVA